MVLQYFLSLFVSSPPRSQLHSLGMSKEEINQRVKENAFSESESIYGTLYGTLDQPEAEEEEWVIFIAYTNVDVHTSAFP